MIEVDRPDRRARRTAGKSYPVDAYAATAVLSGRASGTPKSRDGAVEAIRALRVVRASAVKARTQTTNQIKSLIITAPSTVREPIRSLSTAELIRRLAAGRPGADLANPSAAVKLALKRLAKHYQHLTEEIAAADGELRNLITRTAPGLLDVPGVGTETAGQLLVTAGDNPDRLASEASFAHLCAAAPCQPPQAAPTGTNSTAAETGKPTAHCTRSWWSACATTSAHATTSRRTLEGLKPKDIIRCLKRFVARESYHHLTSAFNAEPTASSGT